jgi:hypothetical protein
MQFAPHINGVVGSPYQWGFVIDHIRDNGVPVEQKTHLVKRYESLVGGLLWLQRHTCPAISTAVSLLSCYSYNLSAGHCKAAKWILAYLQGTLDQGIHFTQGGP